MFFFLFFPFLKVMLRPKVTFVRIKEKCDNESLQVLLSAPRVNVFNSVFFFLETNFF